VDAGGDRPPSSLKCISSLHPTHQKSRIQPSQHTSDSVVEQRHAITYAARHLSITGTPNAAHASRCVCESAITSARFDSAHAADKLSLAVLQQLSSALSSFRLELKTGLSPACAAPASRNCEDLTKRESWRCVTEAPLHLVLSMLARVHCGRIGDDQKGSEDRATVLQYIAPPNTNVAAPT
jgi:hypothetical protein